MGLELLLGIGPRVEPLDAQGLAAVTDAVEASDVQRCYEARLQGDPWVTGRIEVFWTVREGHATRVKVERNTTDDDALADCLVEAVEGWAMPAGIEGSVTWPFVLVTPERNPMPVRASVTSACETRGVVVTVAEGAVAQIRGLVSGLDGCSEDLGVELSGPVPDGIYTVEFASEPVAPTLAAEVAARASDIQSCYEAALRQEPATAGRIELAIRAGEGRVLEATIQSNETGDEALGECITGMTEHWELPPELEDAGVFPFVLGP